MQNLENLTDREKFIIARWAYSVGATPIMSDAEYTMYLRAMEAANPDDEYVKRSWSSDPCPTELLRKAGREDLIHLIVLGDKTESIPSLNSYYEVNEVLANVRSHGTLSMKHDGWNVQSNYYQGELVNIQTRGRASDAVDVSGLSSLVPKTIPFKGQCKVVSELTINKENFRYCVANFGNASNRSAVSTILARPDLYYLLSLTSFDIHGAPVSPDTKFDVLQDWKFKVPKYYHVTTYETIMDALEQLSSEEGTYIEPTDGVVYDGDMRRAIRLLAWEEPIYRSYVTGYLEQYGPYRISPSVKIHPVFRKGTTQRRISMTNWQRIMDYNLRPGAPVAFRVASGTTADFDEDATRLLHKEYEGRWDEYHTMVEVNEEVVKCKFYGS